jgi:hypothetical protein
VRRISSFTSVNRAEHATDRIFGLAFPATSTFKTDPYGKKKRQTYVSFYGKRDRNMRATDFVALNTTDSGDLDTMLQQGLVHGQFSFSYTGDVGEFYLDGWNQEISDGNVTWLDLDLAEDEAPGLWKIKADAIKLNGSDVLPEQRMIVDTGKLWTSIPKSLNKEI